MKSIMSFILVSIILFITSSSYAQGWAVQKNRQPRWISDKGFWQVQSNMSSPRKNTVYFFNNEKLLIYKEEVNGVKLNLSKMSVKMRLKKALEAALVAWDKERVLLTDRQLVSTMFR